MPVLRLYQIKKLHVLHVTLVTPKRKNVVVVHV
jgi:hypothetical protein